MISEPYPIKPGLIILFGSGETSPRGRKIFDWIFRMLPPSPHIALLETPAGFELNSHQVIARVGDFLAHRLQNYSPTVEIIPAQKKGTRFSPDEPEIVAPLLTADLIFMGPGSPSYTIRQLHNSLAWHYLLARYCFGATLVFASAASIAISAKALPVYEIYKVGEDLHWIDGLDLLGCFGLQLVFIPHWNNKEGGTELDTSRCFMGQARMRNLLVMLPPQMTIVGLDEKTALIIDPSNCACYIKGLGKVTIVHSGHSHSHLPNLRSKDDDRIDSQNENDDLLEFSKQHGIHFHEYYDGQNFSVNELGEFHPYIQNSDIPASIWQKAKLETLSCNQQSAHKLPQHVLRLIHARQEARQSCNWEIADEYRKQIEKLGWEIADTKDGPVVTIDSNKKSDS